MASELDRVCVVIPTFNEAANIARLIAALRALSPGLKIIVVDDGSPDGTAQIAEQAGGAEVVDRKGKGGRGSAVLDGFRRALQDPSREFFAEMDADFSHDPRELPEMAELLAAAGGRRGVVVRSRYLGQSRIVDWPLPRRIFSRLSNMLARAALGIPLSDYTNGYRLYTRRALERLDMDRIQARGYIVLSEVAYQLHLKRFEFLQLPTVFVNRRRGESNLNLSEIAGALTSVLNLRRSYADLRAAGRQ